MKKLFLTSLIAMILAMSFSSCGDDGTTECDGFEIYSIYENATSVNLELIKKGVDTLIVKDKGLNGSKGNLPEKNRVNNFSPFIVAAARHS